MKLHYAKLTYINLFKVLNAHATMNMILMINNELKAQNRLAYEAYEESNKTGF